jgi:asparagine synthase (glutamine-hydrolysing)
MGMFFLIRNLPKMERRTPAALRLAELMGFGEPKVIKSDEITLYLFPKLGGSTVEAIAFPNGDFAAACGTFLFGESLGVEALHKLYAAFSGDWSILDDAAFSFSVIVHKNGRTYLSGDRFGGYHIFRDAMLNVVSSSFLIAAEFLDELTVLRQSVFEYVFNGVVSGNDTLVKELTLLPIGAGLIFETGAAQLEQYRQEPIRETSQLGRHELLEAALSVLNKRFELLAKLFGDKLTCALSGGFDSRLILALARRSGARPRLYVYGKPDDKDVLVASAIAHGENFELDIIDKDSAPLVPVADFPDVVARNYLATDGYHYAGVFNNGAERRESASRVAGGAIVLNGGGGEIFRNFFYLLDRRYTVRQLAWSFYSQFDPEICMSGFKSEHYYCHIERKVIEVVGRADRLERPTVEWLYHRFRCRSWDGRVDTINGQYGYTGLPFLTPRITEIGASIPIRWKYHGAFQAELIARTDRRLASYRSSYGHQFVNSPTAAVRAGDLATYARPPWARRLTYRLKHRWRGSWGSPYISNRYVDQVLPGGIEVMRSLFQVQQLRDPIQATRIFTLEYLIRQFGSRARIGTW